MPLMCKMKTTWGFLSKAGFSENDNHLNLVHIDLCGPRSESSLGGADYFMLIVDNNNPFAWAYMLKNKDEAFVCI